MTKPHNNFTLVIQGPLHENLFSGLNNNYLDYTDNIVVSHWDTDNIILQNKLKNYKIKSIANIFHKNFNIYNNQNVYYQVLSTLNGLKHIETEYVIKLRSDQWIGNLEPLFNSILNPVNKDKYVCSNLHFRPDKLFKFHPSDKIIGGATDLILKTFTIALYRITYNVQALLAGAFMYTDDRSILPENMVEKYIEYYNFADINRQIVSLYPNKAQAGTIQVLPAHYIGIVPEVLIGTSFLFAKKIFPDPLNSIEIVKNNFEIVQVEDMFPYINKELSSIVEHNSLEISDISDYDK